MCGIIGYIGKERCQDVLINGLKSLEYRGYDSAGIAYVAQGKLFITKEQGKIKNLENLVKKTKSSLGIGHTRWATHGIPNKINSHPHKQGKITIVHNGIIENYDTLKKDLLQLGYEFTSETDTEVASALLDKLYKETNNIEKAIVLFQKEVKGAYAIGLIVDDDYEHLYALKKASPLIIGLGDNENYIASDVPAIIQYTSKYVTLNDGEFAKISKNDIIYYRSDAKEIKKKVNVFDNDEASCGKNGYPHFMLKEIYEEPETFKNTVYPYIENGSTSLLEKMPDFSRYDKIIITGCGSAMHAGLVGKSLIEECANMPVFVEIASEFRYKKLFIDDKTLVIAISQSGETADTLAAVNIAKEKGADTLGIINRRDSSIARATKYVLYTKAGMEIAVATTKAYLAQVSILSLIALNIAMKNKQIMDSEIQEIFENMKKLPVQIDALLSNQNESIIKNIAHKLYNHDHIFFIGRNIDYALCMEGSLKLKEISYIHSDAYPAGELKHGTISLIEKDTPVIAVVTDEKIADKTISNIKEVKSRGASVTLLTNDLLDKDYDCTDYKIIIPNVHKLLEPIIAIIPLQLLAYYVAILRGCDIDQPKNLAKSVTVE